MDGDGYLCNDDDDDYDRVETQCMLVDRYASQRFSSQNNSANEVACSMQAACF